MTLDSRYLVKPVRKALQLLEVLEPARHRTRIPVAST